MQEQYDTKRGRILELMTADNRREYRHPLCKVFRTEAVILESVSKELFVKALQEVDIPREKKVFIWNKSIKEIKRPEMVILRTVGGKARKEEEGTCDRWGLNSIWFGAEWFVNGFAVGYDENNVPRNRVLCLLLIFLLPLPNGHGSPCAVVPSFRYSINFPSFRAALL